MNEQEARRYRAIGALMELFADDSRPQRAARICEAVSAAGESVETARMVARYSKRPAPAVSLQRKRL